MADVEKEVFGDGTPQEVNQPEAIPTQTEDEEVVKEKPEETVYGAEQDIQEKPDPDPDAATQEQQTALAEEKKKAAFYQAGYQDFSNRLKDLDPDFMDYKDEWKGDFKKQPEQPSTPEPEEKKDEFIADFTESRLRQLIADESQKASTKSYNEAHQKAQYDNDLRTSRTVLNDYISKFEITDEEIKGAAQYAQSLGLDNSNNPKAVTKLVIDRIHMNRMQQNFQGGITQAQADATEKVKQATIVQQPTQTAMPEQRKLTKEEKLLQTMYNLGSSEANKEVFG